MRAYYTQPTPEKTGYNLIEEKRVIVKDKMSAMLIGTVAVMLFPLTWMGIIALVTGNQNAVWLLLVPGGLLAGLILLLLLTMFIALIRLKPENVDKRNLNYHQFRAEASIQAGFELTHANLTDYRIYQLYTGEILEYVVKDKRTILLSMDDDGYTCHIVRAPNRVKDTAN